MAKRDYYEVLGVPKNADEGEIKKHSGTLHASITLMSAKARMR